MRELESRIISEQSFHSSCWWGSVLERLLTDIEQITDGPETFYACQRRFLCGRTIELNTFKRIFVFLHPFPKLLNVFVLIMLMLNLTLDFQHLRLSYIPYVVFGSWLFVFGIFTFTILFTFLLSVLYSINDFHIIPCLWKEYTHLTIVSLELTYNLHHASSCDLYFIIDGKKIVLNFALKNELKGKKILKVMAINDKYFRSCFLASFALLPFVFSPFLVINPFTVRVFFIFLAFGSMAVMLAVYLFITIPLISLLDLCRRYFRWTEPMENKVRSLIMDEELPW
jgi:hypothetical protein